jgi:arabinan endo-1,5-alpha-L-arabinosidase
MMKILLPVLIFVTTLKTGFSQTCNLDQFVAPVIYDTYHEYSNNEAKWAGFNVHDPTVYKDGEYYYMYNTDVGMGYNAGSGCLKRRSKDLVNWEFLGRAFTGVPQSARDFFLTYNSSYTDNGIWAPFLMKYKDEYRLYYSAPGGLSNEPLAFIGYATSTSANGPWTDKGKITASIPGDTINAIDPTVVIDRTNGKHWMAYGSYQTGIYILELDSTSGGIKTPGDRGKRIAGRAGGRHKAIEGPEINYRNGYYYLFVSYDWLEDFYNVRVGRATTPEGPYYDINGVNMANYSDNFPMIQTPYRFNNHEGWQGTGHCSVYNDSGTYYMFNQARPSTDIYNMVLHVREMSWINNWPVVSPERYAAVPKCSFTADSLVGKWEHLLLIYNKSVPHATSNTIELVANGTIGNNSVDTWSLQDSLLTMSWNNGQYIDKVIVSLGYDWENRCVTYLYTGMNGGGLCMWGKKINQKAVDTYNKIESGVTYLIRNHYSNMVMEVPNSYDYDGVSIKQGVDNLKKSQFWKLISDGAGYYSFVAAHSATGRVMQVNTGTGANGADIVLSTANNTDKQKFKIVSNGNGYFRILTKVSNDTSCVDLQGFSIVQGGNIFQWEFLNGVNQAWRFMRIDSLSKTSGVDELINRGVNVSMYPNPSITGNFTIDLEKTGISGNYDIIVLSMNGNEIYKETIKSDAAHQFQLGLSAGIYFVRIKTKNTSYTGKLIVLRP